MDGSRTIRNKEYDDQQILYSVFLSELSKEKNPDKRRALANRYLQIKNSLN